MPSTNEIPVVSETVTPPVEELVTCERCDDEVSLDSARYIDYRFGYSDCYLCDSCLEYEIDMEEDEDEEEDEEEEIKNYNDSEDKDDCPKFTDEEVLSCIDKKGTFGLEFETYGGVKGNTCRDYARSIGYTYSGDGSIEGNNPVEFQTSILKGISGAKSVLSFLGELNKNGYKVNDSCGTHVHLGAIDFFDEFKFKLSDLEKSSEEEKIIIERTLLVNVLDVITNKDELSEWLNDIYMRGQGDELYSSSYRMKSGKISRFSTLRIKVPLSTGGYEHCLYVVRDSQLDKLDVTGVEIVNGSKYFYLGDRHVSDKNTSKIFIKGIDICVYSRPRSEKYHKLKTLFYVYTLFEKLFFSMLPETRKENTYCNPLSTSYSLRDINNCNSQEDIERLWYKKLNLRDVARCKREHYEESRYHAINFHSMFYKHGTVEIRSHHGTLQAHSILMWTALHQEILKGVISGKFNNVFGVNRRSLRNVKDQYKLLIKMLGINDTPIQKFIKYRIDKYSPKSLLEISVVL